jgi:transcriptional regulator with XRE-family HTH domain
MPQKKSPNATDIYIGSRIKARRLQIGFSQEKLGDALGLTFQQVQKYEKGANRVGGSRMQQIADALSAPVSYFFDGASGSGNSKGPATPTAAYTKFIAEDDGMLLMEHWSALNSNERRAVGALVRGLASARARRP